MSKYLRKVWTTFSKNSQTWVIRHYLQIAIFNIVIVLLFLLRSAGYFDPYFLISINLIAFVGFLLLVFLLGAGSREMFVFFLLFWVFASVLRLMNIEIWAERTTVYAYQALLIGVFLLIIESVFSKVGRNEEVKR